MSQESFLTNFLFSEHLIFLIHIDILRKLSSKTIQQDHMWFYLFVGHV